MILPATGRLLDRYPRAGRVLVTYAIGATFVQLVHHIRDMVTMAAGVEPRPCPECAERAATIDADGPAPAPAGDPSPFAGDDDPCLPTS